MNANVALWLLDIQIFNCLLNALCPHYKAIIRLLFLGRCAAVEQLNQSLFLLKPVSGFNDCNRLVCP